MTDTQKFEFRVRTSELTAISASDEYYIVRTYIEPELDKLRGRFKVGDYRVWSIEDPPADDWKFEVFVDIDPLPGVCRICGRPIQVMAFYTTEWCSDDCRKVLQGEDVSTKLV